MRAGLPATAADSHTQAEADFLDWLRAGGLRHAAVAERDAFSALFKDDALRPTALLLLESIGLVAVAVKNHAQCGAAPKGSTLKVGSEIRKALAFERIYRIPYWYAFRSGQGSRVVWHWISALKAFEVGRVRTTERTGDFLSLQPQHFETIASPSDLIALYSPLRSTTTRQHRIGRA